MKNRDFEGTGAHKNNLARLLEEFTASNSSEVYPVDIIFAYYSVLSELERDVFPGGRVFLPTLAYRATRDYLLEN